MLKSGGGIAVNCKSRRDCESMWSEYKILKWSVGWSRALKMERWMVKST